MPCQKIIAQKETRRVTKLIPPTFSCLIPVTVILTYVGKEGRGPETQNLLELLPQTPKSPLSPYDSDDRERHWEGSQV